MEDEGTTSVPDNSTESGDENEENVVHYVLLCIFIAMMITILFSNGLLILLFAYDRRLRVATNYFVMCQCACDFCQGLCMPILMETMLQPSVKVASWCLGSAMLMLLVMSVSFSLQLAIACDRLLAIARPLHYLRLMSLRCSVVISIILLFYGIVMTIILPLIWYDPESTRCFHDHILQPQYYFYIFFPNLSLALILLTICYACMFAIAYAVKKRQSAMFVPGIHTVTPLDDEMKAARTFLLIIGLNVLTYVPGCASYFLVSYGRVTDEARTVCELLSTLPFLHAAFNPWMYAMRLQPFRMSIKRLRKQCKNHRGSVTPEYNAAWRTTTAMPSSVF